MSFGCHLVCELLIYNATRGAKNWDEANEEGEALRNAIGHEFDKCEVYTR